MVHTVVWSSIPFRGSGKLPSPSLVQAMAESITASYQAMTAAEHGLHPPSYPWAHNGPFETFDHAASVQTQDLFYGSGAS